ncbi:hypothetical protein AVE30378_02143 [Achromobacter veterisilvae]|uniref:Phage tail assembly protein n=1 Tax=Achromobacter veterisilvae TaxID=2069367 RepID=A0A446CFD8_9BURK|nr:phage tail assembly protein [Achromobacter veterisilvae]SSW66604.1 hypothetical protein AVE30378_02143 [Achromobacter veterisilvae]
MAKKELQDELVVTLRKPITLGAGADAETYTALNLCEPDVEAILEFNRRAAKDPGDAMRYLIAKISGVPLAVINKVKARDFTKSAAYLTAFMGDEDDAQGDEEPPEGK